MPNLEVALTLDHPRADLIAADDWQAWLSHWATQLAMPDSPIGAYELSLTLTGDPTIAQLNQSYRNQAQATDVLSFAALETDSPLAPELLATEPLYLGDIVISLDTAEQQAEEAGHSLAWETVWLAAHGFLHLLGWDHPDEASLVAMLSKQRELLASVGWQAQN
ncbi:MAG TPA: rRNA maturation RNase YbeY [Leptolyngbyaceae cyanobacterium M65_K2018_010]|nr:rRNA maturation RNase YbeY [Leptolyngbyaceae cyanobacterium M65_K2018_010]